MTLKGLSLINREQIDAIRAAVRELEQAGYIVRSVSVTAKAAARGGLHHLRTAPACAGFTYIGKSNIG